jgi:hypothetical protein
VRGVSLCKKFNSTNEKMKSLKVLALVMLGSIVISSCTKKDEDDTVIPVTGNKVVLQGNISTNTVLKATDTVVLKGYVYVQSGASITFEAGTIVRSDVTEKGALIIERGAQIFANGTANSPVVFTSGKAAGSRAPGDWGGIIILGKATTNRSTEPTIEGGVGRAYGGTDDNDNSGTMTYVRIEYAGIAAQPGSEINGLTFGGVGRGTKIEHIQALYSNDDAFEFFGGTVNCKYLIAFATADDDFDFDFGYRGQIQYAISFRDPAFVDGGDAGNGIECDNDGSSSTATPYTKPILSNITFVGPNGASNTAANHNYANRWRRNTRFELHNSILLGYAKAGFCVDGQGTADGFNSGESKFRNNLVHAITKPFLSRDNTTFNDSTLQVKALAEGNVLTTPALVNLGNISNLNAPSFVPATGSVALTGASFTGLDAAFFTTTTFRGAIGTNDWTTGWTIWNPQTKVY